MTLVSLGMVVPMCKVGGLWDQKVEEMAASQGVLISKRDPSLLSLALALYFAHSLCDRGSQGAKGTSGSLACPGS